jgi:hypothetical protein
MHILPLMAPRDISIEMLLHIFMFLRRHMFDPELPHLILKVPRDLQVPLVLEIDRSMFLIKLRPVKLIPQTRRSRLIHPKILPLSIAILKRLLVNLIATQLQPSLYNASIASHASADPEHRCSGPYTSSRPSSLSPL